MAETQVLQPSGAVTTSGTGQPVVVPPGATVSAFATATAVSGTTPSMQLTLQASADGTNWADVGNLGAAITASGTTVYQTYQVPANFYRLKWVITGTTPSFTFSASVVGQVARAAF